MGKYDLSNFKKKIAPRDKDEVEKGAASRFSKADETLGVDEPQEKPLETKSFARVVRKTFSIPETELELIDKIKADFYITEQGERIHPVTMWHRHKTRKWEFLEKKYPNIKKADGYQLKFIYYLR